LLGILQEIDAILKGINLATEKIEQKAPVLRENLGTFRQIERLALRWLVLAKRMGLPDEVSGAIDKIAQLVVTIRMAMMSINLMMATNPLTVGIGIAGLIGSAASMGTMLEGY
jgi:hypothetical protein